MVLQSFKYRFTSLSYECWVFEANNWFAMQSNGQYSLIGGTVAPGFDYEDFELSKFVENQSPVPFMFTVQQSYGAVFSKPITAALRSSILNE